MKFGTRIVIMSLCAALALVPSCQRKHSSTTEESVQRVPVDFTAVSQTAAAKSFTKSQKPLYEYHEDFGVWAIALQEGNDSPYILWNKDAMAQVKAVKSGDAFTGDYVPVENAYWLSGYKYSFIAVAPYTNGVEGLEMDASTDQETGKDKLTFIYDISGRYAEADYDFDLMGAVAEKNLPVGTAKPTSQELFFNHLLTRINITLTFKDAVDATGQPADVTVDALRLKGVNSKAEYGITYRSAGNDDVELVLECSADENEETTISLTDAENTIHILPQNIGDFVLELDFTVGSGADAISTKNFQIDVISFVGNLTDYSYNEHYNWNITISPKKITFDVKVTDWVDADDEFEFDIQ